MKINGVGEFNEMLGAVVCDPKIPERDLESVYFWY